MSLINKMLQDLDARGGTPAGAALQSKVQLVVRQPRQRAPLLAAGAALLSVALVAGGYFGWRALQRPRALVPVPPVQVKTVLLAPRPAERPVRAALPMAQLAQLAPALVPPPLSVPAPAVQTAAAIAPAHVRATRERVPVAVPLPAAPRVSPARVEAARASDSAVRAAPMPLSEQRAEREYRRALASLQEGRIGDTIASLEQVLLMEPRHEAARQTLVGLLIENNRPEEAMRQLLSALAADVRQPAMAMLLARLQIERGGSGVDTLLRTLPAAAGNGDYHAFLAGALQRQQRHREAAEQYQAALRLSANNGVWLVGLGISLQAEKRNAEALDAFTRANSTASLAPELRAFVERKLQQLTP